MNIFVYGTLMFPEVARSLAGKVNQMTPARLTGYARYEATLGEKANFPFVELDSDQTVAGQVLFGITSRQLAIFDWFEGEGEWYDRIEISIEQFHGLPKKIDANNNQSISCYVIGKTLRRQLERYAAQMNRPLLRRLWDPVEFRQHWLPWYFWNTVVPILQDPQFIRQFGQRYDSKYVAEICQKFAGDQSEN
ncbi:MAG: gamma-glutamylcyclotransferase family protein [Planctomycetota bacterium]